MGQGLCTALQTGSRGPRRLLAPAPGIEREQGFAFTVMLLSREEELRMKTPALLSWCRKKVGQGTKATLSTKTHPTTGHSLPACWDAESSAEAKCKGNWQVCCQHTLSNDSPLPLGFEEDLPGTCGAQTLQWRNEGWGDGGCRARA